MNTLTIIQEVLDGNQKLVEKLISTLTNEEYDDLRTIYFPSQFYFVIKSLAIQFTSTDDFREYPIWQVGSLIFKAKLKSELEPQ